MNTYTNSKPHVVADTTIDHWLNRIKTGKEHLNLIKQIRTLGKTDETINEYHDLKRGLPSISYNFTFNNKYRKEDNANLSTGFIYFDIDDVMDFTQEQLNNIYALYMSAGGKGYAALVKVSGVNTKNFNSTYWSIADKLNIRNKVDKKTCSIAQQAYISHDPKLYINDLAPTFNATEPFDAQTAIINWNSGNTYTTTTYRRYNNFSDYCSSTDAQYFEKGKGVPVIELFFPNQIQVGKRTGTIFNYATNYLYLNPTLTKEEVEAKLMEINNNNCATPVPYFKIQSIVKSIYKYQEEGKLKPIYKRKKNGDIYLKRFLYGKNCGISGAERWKEIHTILGEERKDKTRGKLYEAIETYEGIEPLTQKRLAERSGVSLRTVKMYWNQTIATDGELTWSEYIAEVFASNQKVQNTTIYKDIYKERTYSTVLHPVNTNIQCKVLDSVKGLNIDSNELKYKYTLIPQPIHNNSTTGLI